MIAIQSKTVKAVSVVGAMVVVLAGFIGCLEDRLVDITEKEDKVTEGDGPDEDSEVEEPVDEEDSDVPLTELRLEEEHYEGWEDGDDSYGPEGDPIQCDESHVGYEEARCWDCHAVGGPFEPKDHDPKMQFWAWSCSRGFPGSTCHGHGVNGCVGFSHGPDPSFANCTMSGCHTKFHEEPYLENHAMDNAPDPFCDACHDYYWAGWPEDDDLYKFRDN